MAHGERGSVMLALRGRIASILRAQGRGWSRGAYAPRCGWAWGQVLVLGVMLLLTVPGRGEAEEKSGVSPQAIVAPSGAGAVDGLGGSFEPQLNNGTITYGLGIEVPPGTGGLKPTLRILYSAGMANGPFGPGWGLPLPVIMRQTDKGQPTYTDADGFVDNSGEELVELDDGSYRRENEVDGQFAKIERIGEGWLFRSKSGYKIRLGQYPSASDPTRRSRVAAEDAPAGVPFAATASWLVDEIEDTSGNRVQFSYASYPDSPGVLYLSEVRYSIFGEHYHSVVFDYALRPDRECVAEDPVDCPAANRGTGGLASYQAGFRQIYGRRCTAIRVYADGAPVRKYTFDYEALAPDEDPAPPPLGVVETGPTRLRKITQWDSTFTSYLPPLTFAYGAFDPSGAATITLTDPPPWNLAATGHNGRDLMDVDGDALPDLLDGSQGDWRYARNVGGVGFLPVAFDLYPTLAGSPGFSLGALGAQLLDLNGDGAPDVANASGQDQYIYRHYDARQKAFGPETAFTHADILAGIRFDQADVAALDVDGDKDVDLARFTSSGEHVFIQHAGDWTVVDRAFGDPELGGAPQAGGLPSSFRLGTSRYRVADMNGDRLPDFVELTENPPFVEVRYWPSIGRGRFGAARSLPDMVVDGLGDLDELQLTDLNGDGLADVLWLILAEPSEIRFFLNRGDGTWSATSAVVPAPTACGATATRLADMNANGTIDVLFNSSAAPCLGNAGRYAYVDLAPGTPPYQLIAIDTGMGNRTRVEYRPVAAFARDAELAGRPWTLTLPFPLQVVRRYTTETGLDLDEAPGPDVYETEIRYRDPYYDPFEKEFRGFAFAEKIERGDERYPGIPQSGPGTRTRIAYHTGAPDGIDNDGDGIIDERDPIGGSEEEPLKGLVLWSEVTDVGVEGSEAYPYDNADDVDFLPDPVVYVRSRQRPSIQIVHRAVGGLRPERPVDPRREVRFPIVVETVADQVERGAGPKKVMRTAQGYDAFGNLVLKEEWGEDSPGSTYDDERFTHMEYEHDDVMWVHDRQRRLWTTDERGAWVDEARYSYNDRWLLTNELRFLDPGRVLNYAENTYDPFGNLVTVRNARGFVRTVTYDNSFHIYPVRELTPVGSGEADLVSTATYDRRFGTFVEAVDMNNEVSRFVSDSFGRTVAQVLPGDSLTHPTTLYRYTIADAIRGWEYRYDAMGSLTLVKGLMPGEIATSVATAARELPGQSGVVESIAYSDGLGRILTARIEDDRGFVVTDANLFNSRGRVRASLLPYRAGTSNLPDRSQFSTDVTYDALGREVLSLLPPDAATVRHETATEYLPLVTIEHDAEDRAGRSHDGTPKTRLFDGLGRLLELVEVNRLGSTPGNYITRYKYNLRNDLTEIYDAQHNVKRMAYDGISRKVETDDPDTGTFLTTYDDAGNVLETLDANGSRVTYSYDGANRLVTEDYGADGVADVRYHYDRPSPSYPFARHTKGRLSWIEDRSGAEIRSFDAHGNQEEVVKQVRLGDGRIRAYTSRFRYDSLDRIRELTYPDGNTLSYDYNARGLLASIPGVVDAIEYAETGQRVASTYVNGVMTRYVYDPRRRLRQLAMTSAQAMPLQDLTFELDGVGNISAITDGRPGVLATDPRHQTQTFVVDDLYRMISAQGGYGRIDYAYDAIGNLTSQTSPTIADPQVNLGVLVRGGTAGAMHRGPRAPREPAGPHAVTATASGRVVAYDDVGNMVDNGGDVYVWDPVHRLARVENSAGEVVRFSYDFAGQRVRKSVDGDHAEVLYIGKHAEIRGDTLIKYVFADGERVAHIEGPLPTALGGATTQSVILEKGWNLVPLRVQPADPRPASAFQSLASVVSGVYLLEPGGYSVYRPSGPPVENTLTTLAAGRAYWVHLVERATLTLEGTPISGDPLMMRAGWHSLVMPGAGSRDIVALAAADPQLLAFWLFSATTQRWQGYRAGAPIEIQELPTLAGGDAMLIYVADDTSLRPVDTARRMFFYHPDQVGSSNIVTDETGTIVEELAYYPYGLLRYRHVPGADVFHSERTFGGKERDIQSGLFYFETRYYDAVLNAFASADDLVVHRPATAKLSFSQFLHPYTFALNNPIVHTDPDGQIAPILAYIAVGAVIGAGSACVRGCSMQQALSGAGMGAVSGAIGFGALHGVAAAAGVALTSGGVVAASAGTGAAIAVGAASGAVATYANIGVQSLIATGRWRDASFGDVGLGAAIGGASQSIRGEQSTTMEGRSGGGIRIPEKIEKSLEKALNNQRGATGPGGAWSDKPLPKIHSGIKLEPRINGVKLENAQLQYKASWDKISMKTDAFGRMQVEIKDLRQSITTNGDVLAGAGEMSSSVGGALSMDSARGTYVMEFREAWAAGSPLIPRYNQSTGNR